MSSSEPKPSRFCIGTFQLTPPPRKNPLRCCHVSAAVARVNQRLSPIERVRRFVVAAEPFTIANGQMTPTLKIKRHVIRDAYGAALDALYDSKDMAA